MQQLINKKLSSLLKSLKLDTIKKENTNIKIIGKDPIIKTPWYIGEATTTALSAQAIAISEIHNIRNTKPKKQLIKINVIDAALSTARCMFLKQNGYPVPFADIEYPTVGIYKCKNNRHVFLNGGFPALRRGILKFLECADNVESISNITKNWDAQKLEKEMQKQKLCCVMIRSSKEWQQTKQGSSLLNNCVDEYPISIEKISDTPPQPLTKLTKSSQQPLSNIKVLDLTHVLAGPTCGMMLAEQGATVMRINGPQTPFILPFVMDTGHGKLNSQLDLKTDIDKERMWNLLLNGADIISNSYRPGKLSSLGFSPEIISKKLKKENKGIIYVSINCYGYTGPWKDLPGWEQLAQCATGLAVEHSSLSNPQLMPTFPNDYITGYLAANGVLAALLKRHKYGGSYHVKVSLCATAMWLQSFGKFDKIYLPKEIMPHDRIEQMLKKRTTPYGVLSFFGHPINYELTKAKWKSPTVPIGYNQPIWPKDKDNPVINAD